MAEPGASRNALRPLADGPKVSRKVPSGSTSISRSSNAVRLPGTLTGE
jgi:hypothetical protein